MYARFLLFVLLLLGGWRLAPSACAQTLPAPSPGVLLPSLPPLGPSPLDTARRPLLADTLRHLRPDTTTRRFGADTARRTALDTTRRRTAAAAPDTARHPLPPRAIRARLVHPRALVWAGTPADVARVRRYHPRATVPDSLAALRTVRELVLALQAESYLLASADTMRWGRDTVRVQVFVGEAFRWAHLRNGNLGDALLTSAGFREKFFRGKPFRPAEWAALQERVLTEAENHGYPFASIGLDSVALHGQDIAGRVVLRHGPAITFDSLEIVGTSHTKKRFLSKYLQISPGEPYSQERVRAAAALLRQLPYVRLRAEPEVRFARNRARIYLLLDERPANQFDAIVGLLPNSTGRGMQFTGDVTIALRNLRGGGKQAGLQWRKVDALTQTLDASYLHPNIFGSPLEVATSFNLYRQNGSFLTLRPRVQVTYPTAQAGRLAFFAEWRSSRLLYDSAYLATLSTLPPNLDSEASTYGLAYARTYLDDLFFPHRGSFVTVQGGAGTKSIRQHYGLPETLYAALPLRTVQYSLGGRAEHYWPLGRQGVVLLRLRGEGLFNQQQQYYLNDLFRLGGLNSLRGFSENQFYTNAYGVGTLELRQFIGPEGYVFLFADQAVMRAFQPDLSSQTDAPSGLGAGLSFRTGAGLFQFVYSVGRSPFANQSFGLSNSKIHFGLTSRF